VICRGEQYFAHIFTLNAELEGKKSQVSEK
jgi:hypothetical protein